MLFVKSAGIMGAASLISMGAAAASEPDDLFAAGLLELNEKPMTANELGEARGGFSFGGLDFNIGVQVLPPTFNPLPDGPFGANGGPFGSQGGPFGAQGGPFGNNSNNNSSQNNTPAAPQSSAPSTPTASTQQPAAQPTNVASAAPAAPATPPAAATPAPSAPASTSNTPTPPAATATPSPAPTATNTTTTSAPPASPTTTTNPAPSGNTTQTASNSKPATSTPFSPLPNSGSSSTGASQSSQGSSGSNTPPPEISAAPTKPIPVPASAPKTRYSTPLAMSLTPGKSGGGAQNSSSDAQTTTMSATMRDIDDRTPIRGIESNGLSSIVNNTLNNVFISQEVVMNVQVTNYDFAMSMRRVSNVTSQAVSQSFFLPGLN